MVCWECSCPRIAGPARRWVLLRSWIHYPWISWETQRWEGSIPLQARRTKPSWNGNLRLFGHPVFMKEFGNTELSLNCLFLWLPRSVQCLCVPWQKTYGSCITHPNLIPPGALHHDVLSSACCGNRGKIVMTLMWYHTRNVIQVGW